MSRFTRALALAALSFALVTGLLSPSLAEAFKRTEVGETAKDFTLPALDGEKVTLMKSLGPKATLVAFWAAWSPRSLPMLTDMQTFLGEHEKDGLKVLAVNVEHQSWSPEDEPKIREAVKAASATYTVLLDKDFAVYNDYGVVVVPSLALLDKDGKIVSITNGYSSTGKDALKEEVLKALGLVKAEEKVAKKDEDGYKANPLAVRHLMMAEKFLDKKMYSKAESAAKDAIGKDGEYALAYKVLSEALKKQGKEEESAAAVKKFDELETKYKAAAPAEPKTEEQKDAKPADGKGSGTSMSPADKGKSPA